MREGSIIGIISNIYIVETNGELYECSARGKLKNQEIVPVVGDMVEIKVTDEENKKAVINNILPRRNYIKRPKLANIDRLILVISAKQPKPDLLMLDKQLAFAEFLGIEACIVINKIDLEKKEIIENITNTYENIGYKVYTTNAKEKQGINELKNALKSGISAFSGNSGVGKSTLLNAIFDKNITQEGMISQKNKKGKNTTTAIRLYKLENNIYIADTPGFGAFDVYEIQTVDLYKYFKEFKELEKDCQFVGCTHIKEQECGIRMALEKGGISNLRYENYIKIYEDLKDKEEHKW